MRKVEPTGRTPPCRASPLRITPIPCSRTPKWMFLACHLPAATLPPSLKTTWVEPARSAEPPISSGSFGAMEEHLSRGGARRLRVLHRERGQVGVPAVREPAAEPPLQLGGEVGVRPAVGFVLRLPLRFQPGAT